MSKGYKVLVVGDESIGKSSFMKRCAQDKYGSNYEDCTVHTVVDDKNVKLILCKAPSQDSYSQIRTLSYDKTNVIILAFSVVDHKSLENVEKKWLEEVKEYCSKVPFILVGTKKDLRNDTKTLEKLTELKLKPITKEEGKAMAEKLGAKAYEECSALKNEGIWRAITVAARVAIKGKK